MTSQRFELEAPALLLALMAAAFSITFLIAAPRANAAALTVSALTATSTNVYANTGLATTSRVTTGDNVNFQLNLSGTPLIAPQINILGMGSTTMSGGTSKWYYATTTASVWTEGALSFLIGVGGTAGDATTTVSQADITSGANVTYDATAPTLNSVAWSDADSSTQLSSADTLTFTFSETMATTTITSTNADTTLGLTNSHTFGSAANGLALSWNTAGNVLTMTLGSNVTASGADTVDPSSAVKDSVGVADATGSAITVPDTTVPGNPTGLADTTFTGLQLINLASTGGPVIRYTTDGSTPTCTTGTLYTGSDIILSSDATVKAIACDEANNASSVVTAVYTQSGSGSTGGGGGGGGSSSNASSNVAAHVGGLTSSQINSVVQLLQAFGADASVIANVQASLAGGSGVGATVSTAVHLFQADRSTGSVGEDVKALQQYLNGHGFIVAASGAGSPGNETTTFGSKTKAALAKFQASVGISPAVGYFGPLTRAYINTHP